jgi:hypothetical protein
MAIQLGSAYGKVALDVKGLLSAVMQGKAGLESLASAGENIGAGMKRAGQAMTIGLTLPILAAGAASIKAASNFEETKNKAVVVFGEMSNSVVSNANKAATALGVSRTQYLDYASSIGAALTAGGMGIKQSTELAEGAVKHFADLASFHNARVEDVAVAWQSAIRGQYEPIQRYFPFITNEYMLTYGTANGLVDANTEKLTANQRAIILNAIALDSKLNPAINDFAETSKGLANQGRITEAEFRNLMQTFGENLRPIVATLIIEFNKLLEKLNSLSPVQQKMIIVFLAMVAAMGPVLVVLGTVISFVSTLIGFTSGLAGMGISLGAIGAALGTAGTAIVGVGAASLPVIGIVLAVIAVVGLLYWAWKKNLFGIQDLVAKSAAGYRYAWERFTSWWQENTKNAGANVQATFANMGPNIQSAFQRFGTSASAGWNAFMSWLRNALMQARNYIANAFSNVNWGTLGKNILMGLANGMLLGLPNLLVIAKKIADSLLKQIKTALGIHSPSAEAMKLGMFTAQGFQLGLQKVSPEDMARSLARPITGGNTSTQQTIIQNFASGLTMQQVRGMIAENNEALVNTMVGALGGA